MARGVPFKKGNSGRPKGSVNTVTKTVRETFAAVFNDLQDDPKYNLKAFAKSNPKEFYQMTTKLIPTEITGTVAATVTWNETKTYEAEQKANDSP